LLINAGSMSRRNKQAKKPLVVLGSEGFLHEPPAKESAAGKLIPKRDYPKSG
jgi:hypothetical protein